MKQVGDRVQLHPATDRWMMGDRYGVVMEVKMCKGPARTNWKYRVKLDRSGKSLWFKADDVLEAER
jgi:hypothetical protein